VQVGLRHNRTPAHPLDMPSITTNVTAIAGTKQAIPVQADRRGGECWWLMAAVYCQHSACGWPPHAGWCVWGEGSGVGAQWRWHSSDDGAMEMWSSGNGAVEMAQWFGLVAVRKWWRGGVIVRCQRWLLRELEW